MALLGHMASDKISILDKINMKRTITSIVLLLLSWSTISAQITIEECYKKARENYPLIKQYQLIEKAKEYSIANVNKLYFPQISFSAKATYQSDVVQLPEELSELAGLVGGGGGSGGGGGGNGSGEGLLITPPNKDQYGAVLDIRQSIWDGGIIEAYKESIRTGAEVQRASLELAIYSINERVNQLYFGLLLADAKLELQSLLQKELERNYDQIATYMESGIANQSDLDVIRVNLLEAKQGESQLLKVRESYLEMLSLLIGEKLESDTELIKPQPFVPTDKSINRPELLLYDARIRNLDAQHSEIVATLMPKFAVTLKGGYGNPGLDMLKNRFEFYYVAGFALTFDISQYFSLRGREKVVNANIRSVEAERETFLFNTRMDIRQQESRMDSYYEQLIYDDEIIELRRAVKEASEIKMANGTLSANDLMRDINAEQMARQEKAVREMEYLLTIYNLKFATNN